MSARQNVFASVWLYIVVVCSYSAKLSTTYRRQCATTTGKLNSTKIRAIERTINVTNYGTQHWQWNLNCTFTLSTLSKQFWVGYVIVLHMASLGNSVRLSFFLLMRFLYYSDGRCWKRKICGLACGTHLCVAQWRYNNVDFNEVKRKFEIYA